MTPGRFVLLFGLLVLAVYSLTTRAQQPVETETARLPQKGRLRDRNGF